MHDVWSELPYWLAFIPFVAFFVAMIVESSWFGSARGPFLRGIPVWWESLSPELVAPLGALPEMTERDWGWARRDGDRLLLRASPNQIPRDRVMRYRTSWPYVAVIDLARRRVVFRQPITTSLFVLPHLVLFFPFVVVMFAFNHLRQAPSVRAALQELAEEGVMREAGL